MLAPRWPAVLIATVALCLWALANLGSPVAIRYAIDEGLSNNEIADRLGVRFFTARNHVERTLAKLRVTSRHRVGPLLRNELATENRSGRASAA